MFAKRKRPALVVRLTAVSQGLLQRPFARRLSARFCAASDPMSPEDYMRMALAEADLALGHDDVPVGAVVVSGDGVVLAREHNRREKDGDPTAHAELLALREATRHLSGWRLQGATVYVTLEPCVMCAGALVNARVARLVFGASDPKAGAVVSLFRIGSDTRLNHRFEVTGGLLADECAEELSAFFAARRAKRT